MGGKADRSKLTGRPVFTGFRFVDTLLGAAFVLMFVFLYILSLVMFAFFASLAPSAFLHYFRVKAGATTPGIMGSNPWKSMTYLDAFPVFFNPTGPGESALNVVLSPGSLLFPFVLGVYASYMLSLMTWHIFGEKMLGKQLRFTVSCQAVYSVACGSLAIAAAPNCIERGWEGFIPAVLGVLYVTRGSCRLLMGESDFQRSFIGRSLQSSFFGF